MVWILYELRYVYILKNKVNLWSLRRFFSDYKQIYLYRLLIEISLVAPVAILAASF